MKNLKTTFILFFTITFFISCSSDDGVPEIIPVATSAEIVASSNNQSAIIGTELPNPIEILVIDQNGKPFTGASVNFTTSDGSVSATEATTDASGNASVNWTLGARIGTQTLSVTALKADGTTPLSASPLTVTADATSEPVFADNLNLISGDNQTAIINTAVSNPIVVQVLDQHNNPFPEATVNFTTSDGSVSATEVTTDASGNASVNWTLGASIGIQTLSVTALKADRTTPLSASPLTVTADATPEPVFADNLNLISGDNQTAIINTAVSNPIVVQVLDQHNNPFPEATVNFTTSDGSVSATEVTTDASGNASVNWTLGASIGIQTLSVTALKADGTTPLSASPLAITATGENYPCIKRLNPTSIAIPDNDRDNGVLSVINITDNFTITDVNVTINVIHPADLNLEIYLVSPDGTEVPLTISNGGFGDNYINTVFDDDATKLIADYAGGPSETPFTGSYQPQGSLATLNGKSATGNWTLKIYDSFSGDIGTLSNWAIELCGI